METLLVVLIAVVFLIRRRHRRPTLADLAAMVSAEDEFEIHRAIPRMTRGDGPQSEMFIMQKRFCNISYLHSVQVDSSIMELVEVSIRRGILLSGDITIEWKDGVPREHVVDRKQSEFTDRKEVWDAGIILSAIHNAVALYKRKEA